MLVDNSPTQRTEYIVVVISERSKCIETFLLCARFVLVINACKDYSEKEPLQREKNESVFKPPWISFFVAKKTKIEAENDPRLKQ